MLGHEINKIAPLISPFISFFSFLLLILFQCTCLNMADGFFLLRYYQILNQIGMQVLGSKDEHTMTSFGK